MPGANYCAVKGCGNNSQNRRDLSFYRLPADCDRKQEWLLAMGREDLLDKSNVPNTYRVCSVHFKLDMIINRRLNQNAVPVLHLGRDVVIDVDESRKVKEEPVESEALPGTITFGHSSTDMTDEDFSKVANTNAMFVPNSSNYIEERKQKDSVIEDVSIINYQKEYIQHITQQFTKEIPKRKNSNKRFKEEGVQTAEVLIVDMLEEQELRNELIENEKKLSQLEVAITDLQDLVKDGNKTALSRKRKLYDDIENDNNDLSFDFNVIRNKLCPSNFFGKFLRWQEVLCTKYKGNRYEDELKLFAFTLFSTNPKLYRFLQKAFTLPSIRTIQRMKFSFDPSVNDELISLLSKRLIAKPPAYKYCIICLDEVKLKKNLCYNVISDEIIGFKEIDGRKYHEIAEKAFVVILKGCFGDYKQPLGYALTTYDQNYTDLSNWLDKTITSLFNAGFVVCAVVSDRKLNLVDFAKSKGVSVENPYFMINDKKIFYIFDVPDLFTALRNILLCAGKLSFDENKLISWSYIKAFYQNDQKREIKRAPKLQEMTFDCNVTFDRSKVCYATQVLSYTVASGMSSDIELGNLPTQAQDTIDFILKMDQLYDILNSTKEENNINKYKRPFCGANYQIQCLLDSLKIFQTISAKSVQEILFCLQITITSFMKLQSYFKSLGINCMYPGHLNNDETDKILMAITKSSVTANKLKKMYSKLIIDYLFENSDDSDADLESLFTEDGVAKPLFKSQIVVARPVSLRNVASDCNKELPKQNTFTCFCQYLLDKIAEHHICSMFKPNVQHNEKDQEQLLEKTDISEIKAPPEFIALVECLEAMFINKFPVLALEIGTAQKLLLEMSHTVDDEDARPCDCFPTSHFIKLYLRMRIHHVIKLINKQKSTNPLPPFEYVKHL